METFFTKVMLYANLIFPWKVGIWIISSLFVVCNDANPMNSNLFNFTLNVEYNELTLIVPEYCFGFASVPK